jgi:hypothetical protein
MPCYLWHAFCVSLRTKSTAQALEGFRGEVREGYKSLAAEHVIPYLGSNHLLTGNLEGV